MEATVIHPTGETNGVWGVEAFHSETAQLTIVVAYGGPGYCTMRGEERMTVKGPHAACTEDGYPTNRHDSGMQKGQGSGESRANLVAWLQKGTFDTHVRDSLCSKR